MRRAVSSWLAVVGLVALTVVAPAHAQVSVRAEVDRSQVFVGEPFALTIHVAGTQQAETPSVGGGDEFVVRYVGPTTQFSSVNGSVTTSVSHRWALTGRRPGRFRLGPFQVRAEGQVHTAAAVEVQVAPRTSEPPPSDERGIELILTADKTTAYVGERIPLRVQLRVGDVAVDNLYPPKLEAEGFTIDAFAQPSRSQEISRGQRWTVLGFRSTATALRPGTLALGPATMQLETVEATPGAHGSFFDRLLGAARRVPRTIVAATVPVEVKPLPAAGRPADFSGAVGQFDLIASAAPAEVAVGDPVTVRLEVRGFGNLDAVHPPRLAVDERFRAYEPTATAGAAGPGRLALEQVLIPRDPTVTEVPEVRFTFFEPESGTYRTVARGPFPLSVRAAATPESAPAVVGGTPPEPAAAKTPLARDIVYIKERPGDLRRSDAPLHRRPWFFAAQAAPVVLAVGTLVVSRRRRRTLADTPAARAQRAGRHARRELAALANATADPDFYDRLAASVGDYLAAKLDLPPGAVDRESVVRRLARNDRSGELQSTAARWFDAVERARYAPAPGPGADRAEALGLAQALVGALERDRRLARATALVFALAFALPLTLPALAPAQATAARNPASSGASPGASKVEAEGAPGGAVAATTHTAAQRRDPYTIFHDANVAYRSGNHVLAARELERLLSAGFESAAVFFNLGNAYFKQRDFGRAILAYERARRAAPRDADARANLALARELAEAPAQDVALWRRAAFALASFASTRELAVVWTVVWCAAWALMALRWSGRAARGATAVWIAVAIAGASFGVRLWQDEISGESIVVAHDAVARFEPVATGKEHFPLVTGSAVGVRDVRDGWVQVMRADGLRGWVEGESVERIRR